MKNGVISVARVAVVALLVMGAGRETLVQSRAAAVSSAKAKELGALMKSKKLEVFAVREASSPNRFVAVMVMPDVQTLLVSAAYSRASDMEFYLYQKDYMNAYRGLKSGALASDAFFVEDVLGDGLVPVPGRNTPPDSVTVNKTLQIFEGPADPRKRNDKRMAADAYAKTFGDADERYARLLDEILAELKKSHPLVPSGVLR